VLFQSGAVVHEACDLYSFAMILWEIWSGTGETPFETIVAASPNKSSTDFMNNVIQQHLRPECGSTWDVAELIAACWVKDPQKRPSFALCVEALTLIQKGGQEPHFLSELLRRDRSAKAAGSTVSSINANNDFVEPQQEEPENEGFRRLTRMTVKGNMTAIPSFTPCKLGINCEVPECKFLHPQGRARNNEVLDFLFLFFFV
jgi:hypothetical protein